MEFQELCEGSTYAKDIGYYLRSGILSNMVKYVDEKTQQSINKA